jgi:hypothetical protein
LGSCGEQSRLSGYPSPSESTELVGGAPCAGPGAGVEPPLDPATPAAGAVTTSRRWAPRQLFISADSRTVWAASGHPTIE